MPLPLIALILIAAAVFIVVILVILYWSEIKDWFNSWDNNNLKTKDIEDVGFTLTQKIESGRFKTIQGVFNKKNNEVKDGRVIESKQVDDGLFDDDDDETLVIFE